MRLFVSNLSVLWSSGASDTRFILLGTTNHTNLTNWHNAGEMNGEEEGESTGRVARSSLQVPMNGVRGEAEKGERGKKEA